MPTYSYKCEECNEVKDHMFRFSNRLEAVDCESCNGISKRVFTISDAQTNDPYNKKEPRKRRMNGLVMHLYKCSDCGHKFDELVDFSKNQNYDDPQECPECQSMNSSWLPMYRIDRFSEMFPYYDRGLGVMLQSKQHRLDICKQRGLTPVDGDWNADKMFKEWDTKRDKQIKEYDDYCDRLENHPGFRQFRIARDKRQL